VSHKINPINATKQFGRKKHEPLGDENEK
jgi:hypothetical protein